MKIDEEIILAMRDIIENHPANWLVALKRIPSIVEYVQRVTTDFPPNIPDKDRYYSALTGTSPICKYGNLQTLKNVFEGWKGCGRAGVCMCAKEKVSSATKKTKADTRQNAIFISDNESTDITSSNIIDDIKTFIATTPAKLISQAIIKEARLLAWIRYRCVQMDISDIDIKMTERIYLALNGLECRKCECGNNRVFNTLEQGYRPYCSPSCPAKHIHQSKIIKIRQAEVSESERARRQEKQLITLKTNHGDNISNPMDIASAVIKQKATNNQRYGTDYPIQSNDILTKIKATNQQNHGVDYPLQNITVQQKAKDTFLANHGHENDMRIPRNAFADQNNGIKNPFEMEIHQQTAKATMLVRYGHEHALQNSVIYQKMIDGVFATLGVTNVALDPNVKEKTRQTILTRYNRRFVNQEHISDESYAILQDETKFKELASKKSIREFSIFLGISYDGLRKYYDRYDIPRPKSSYEIALYEFLINAGITNILRGDRTIIKPLELDLVIPDQKIAIEFCGLYYHGDKIKSDNRYHLNKLEMVRNAGYRLITIFEDELVLKPQIVESRILHIISDGEKNKGARLTERGIGARHASIRTVDQATAHDFYNTFHIQGAGNYGFVNFGAYYGDDLLAVMTFGKGRIATGGLGGPTEMLRFATDGRNHPGIASRLFKTFVNEYHPEEIVSFADRRWSNGNLYIQLGFSIEDMGTPNYWYVHKNHFGRYHRFGFRKSEIKGLVPNGENKTEKEIMDELGYYRIYDCGSIKFRWKPCH